MRRIGREGRKEEIDYARVRGRIYIHVWFGVLLYPILDQIQYLPGFHSISITALLLRGVTLFVPKPSEEDFQHCFWCYRCSNQLTRFKSDLPEPTRPYRSRNPTNTLQKTPSSIFVTHISSPVAQEFPQPCFRILYPKCSTSDCVLLLQIPMWFPQFLIQKTRRKILPK